MKQIVVLRVTMNGQDARTKAMKIAVSVPGVEAVSFKGKDKEQIEVKGENIDTVKLTTKIRKKVGHADIVSVAEDKKEEKKEDKKMGFVGVMPPPSFPIHGEDNNYSNCCSIL